MEAEVQRLLQCQKENADPFTILKVDLATCTVDDVSKSFRKIVVLVHPDKCKIDQAGTAFHVAEKAYRTLEVESNILRLREAAARKAKKEEAMRARRAAANSHSGDPATDSTTASLNPQERREALKRDRLQETQLEAARLAEETEAKRRRVEQQRAEQTEMAAELKRQAEEWQAMQSL